MAMNVCVMCVWVCESMGVCARARIVREYYRRYATSIGQVVGPRGLESSQFNCWERRIRLASSSVTSPSPTARCGYTHHALHMLLYSHCTHIHTLCVQSRETLNVSQFHIANWAPDGSCSNIKTVTDVIDEIIKVQIRTGNKPITVHCRFILVLLTVVLTDHVCVCAVTQ